MYNKIPFELARLPNELDVVDGIVELFEIQKGVNMMPSRRQKLPATAESHHTVECDDWFLDFDIDGI